MAYPDNVFQLDQLEPDQYGGREDGGATFDGDAWTWITGLVRAISARVIAGTRMPWVSSVAVVQEGVNIGDIIAVDVYRDAYDPTTQLVLPYVAKYGTVVTEIPIILGVCVEAAAAGGKVTYAHGGLLPPAITGLTGMTAGALLAADATTSRLRAWVSGDDALAYTSPGGSALLLFPGRMAA